MQVVQLVDNWSQF